MTDLRLLTDAELDFVGGGLGMVGGCDSGTTTFASVSRPTSDSLTKQLAQEIRCDILQILFPQKAVARAD